MSHRPALILSIAAGAAETTRGAGAIDPSACSGRFAELMLDEDLVVRQGATCDLMEVWVDGNVEVVGGGAVTLIGITVNGNLISEDNDGAQLIEDNTIGGNLVCEDNEVSPTGGGNTVQGGKEDQCSDL